MYNLYRYMSEEEVQKAFWKLTINALGTGWKFSGGLYWVGRFLQDSLQG